MSREVRTRFPPRTYSSSYLLANLPKDVNLITIDHCHEENSMSNNFQQIAKDSKTRPKDLSKNTNHVSQSTTINGDQTKCRDGQLDTHSTGKNPRKSQPLPYNNSIMTATFSTRINRDDEASLLKFLAFNALDLSAPATDVVLMNRNSSWFQLSGHPDSLAPAGPGTVWKKRATDVNETERIVYEEFSRYPPLSAIAPRYYREVSYQNETFIELQNLLHGFQDPYVMDIKMGTRTFLESEVAKTTARPDLYQKMVTIDPDAPTHDEHKSKAITKLRYMLFRELQSSTCSHGFRIEAIKCRGAPPMNNLKTVKLDADVRKTLDQFLAGRDSVRQRLIQRLHEIRHSIEQSDFFRVHEVIGASVFIVYDDVKVGAWLIDFAKTTQLPPGMTVDHRSPWIQGNREEGLLFGFDQLISVIASIECTSSRDYNGSFSSTTVSVKS